ncbi:MAG: type II toxin-antitoxin system VapC family toxin [Chloroflexi bacterium]|nr:type II toxin-antitoxin system VapC family toxin [Chloroflexota bacterium]
MKRLIFDTSVYVHYLRRGDLASVVESITARGVVHLSAVVAEELLVGAPSDRAVHFLLALVNRFSSVGRLEVPEREDWLRAGQAIRRLGRERGYELVRRARLTNDALIAAAAFRTGATIITRNAEDFALLRPYLPVAVVPM